MFNIRYFSFTDPITAGVSKTYGYTYEHVKQNLTVKRVKGEAVILKNHTEKETRNILPLNAVELTEEAFNALDTTNESLTSRLARERQFLKIKKLQSRFSKEAKPVDVADVITKFSALVK